MPERLRTLLTSIRTHPKLSVALLQPVFRKAGELGFGIVRPRICGVEVDVPRVPGGAVEGVADIPGLEGGRKPLALPAHCVVLLPALATEREWQQDPVPIVRYVLLRVCREVAVRFLLKRRPHRVPAADELVKPKGEDGEARHWVAVSTIRAEQPSLDGRHAPLFISAG